LIMSHSVMKESARLHRAVVDAARDGAAVETPRQALASMRSDTRLPGAKPSTEIAVIGAGPYGLSVAAHVNALGLSYRIIGQVMDSWRCQMPAGMLLKSPGFASNLDDQARLHTLAEFCARTRAPYHDYALPIKRETFLAYGMEFQRQLVPIVEETTVRSLDGAPGCFVLRLADGRLLTARRVIVAVGGTYFKHVPRRLTRLPPDRLSHSADHCDVSPLKGRRVAIIGAGASAIDLAAELYQVGAEPYLIARRSSLSWALPAPERPMWKRWYPMSGLGGGWNRFYATAPGLFRYLPPEQRLMIVRTALGPAGALPVKDIVLENVPLFLGRTIEASQSTKDGVRLRLLDSDAASREISVHHVIAATGYRVALGRLTFIDDKLRARIQSFADWPVLSRSFESSVPGLYFVGLAAAHSFGPVMRFVLGAAHTARRLARHFAGAEARVVL
jgi:thioredoxin reductase